MKKYTIGIITAVLLFTLLAGIFIVGYPLVQRYVYFGDRLSVNINSSVDGQQYIVNSNDVKCIFEEDNVAVNGKDNHFSTKGNEYGLYKFEFNIKNNIVNVRLMKTNWWEINTADLKLDINTKTNTLKYIIGNEKGSINLKNNKYSLYYMF